MASAFDDFVRLIPYVLLVSVRVGAAIASLPAPFGSLAPNQVRVALGLFLSIALVLPHPEVADTIHLDPLWMAGAALGEGLVGAAIGLVARLCLAAAEAAGEVISGSMGMGFAQQFDPTLGSEASVVGRVLTQLAVLVFFAMQGHHAVIAGLARSLEAAPVGAAWNGTVMANALDLGRDLVAAGLRIASPVMGTMLIVQLGVALTARAAPRLQVFSISYAIAASVGMLILVIAAPTLAEAIAAHVRDVPERIAALLMAPL